MTLAELITHREQMAGRAGTGRPRRCKVGRTLDAVPPEDRAAILNALHGHEWTDTALSHVLDRGGLRSAASALGRHRTRDCVCNAFGDDEPEPQQ